MVSIAGTEIDHGYLIEVSKRAFTRLDSSEWAFLFATGKNELAVRDFIAFELNKSLNVSPPFRVDREWKRHDLALMHGHSPLVLIEGKAWCHQNLVNDTKLKNGKKSVRSAIETDIEKMRSTQTLHPDLKTFISIVVFSVDSSSASHETSQALAYKYEHSRGLKEFGSIERLRQEGNSRLHVVLENYGPTSMLQVLDADYQGMRVVADFFLTATSQRK